MDIPDFVQQVARYDSQGQTIHTTKGSYAVTVNPALTTKKAVPSLTLRISNDPKGDCSVNASCACGILPGVTRGITDLIDDIIPSLDMTVIWYLNEIIDWDESYKVLKFMQTAAHESDHLILANYAYKSTGLKNYSWVHKGSLKDVVSGYSIPKYGEKGHETYPLGKADLMKYYAYGNIYPDDYQSTEVDIKSLIWLSRITSQ